MNTVAIKLDVKTLLIAGIFFMILGLFLLGDVTIGIACASIVLGIGVDLLFGIPAVCVLSYVGELNISGFVFMGFGLSRLLMAWQADRLNNESK